MKLITDRYLIIREIGKGSFGHVYECYDYIKNKNVAVKIEILSPDKTPLLEYEGNIYRYLNSFDLYNNLVPRVYEIFKFDDFNAMVMDLLGDSLSKLFRKCGKKFTLKTVIFLAIQMINCLEYIHRNKIIHRDIKLDNFAIGKDNNKNSIYIYDFGLAKKFLTHDNRHIPYRENRPFIGTLRYASINAQLGIEQSRRDDFESLGYVLIYMLKGSLPWQNIDSYNKKDKHDKILKAKLAIDISALCFELPHEIYLYFSHIKKLDFTDTPNYEYLKNLFYNIYKNIYQNCKIIFYDWEKEFNFQTMYINSEEKSTIARANTV